MDEADSLHFEKGDILYDMEPNFKIGQYNIEPTLEAKVFNQTSGGGSGSRLVVTITLVRSYWYHMVTIFFPTACLMVVACLTLLIKPNRFEAGFIFGHECLNFKK